MSTKKLQIIDKMVKQPDWNQIDETAVDYIKNKPDINGIVDDLNVRIDETKESLNNSISSSLEEAKSYSDDNLDAANAYTDGAVSQKSQVQIVTPEATEILSTLKIHRLTQEEYDEKVEAGTIDENTLYLTPDEVIDLSDYATKEYVDSKTVGEHNHDDLYYTETEIDIKISDLNTGISSSLEEAKSYSNSNLEIAKTYTDNAVAQKSMIQIITWEADD